MMTGEARGGETKGADHAAETAADAAGVGIGEEETKIGVGAETKEGIVGDREAEKTGGRRTGKVEMAKGVR